MRPLRGLQCVRRKCVFFYGKAKKAILADMGQLRILLVDDHEVVRLGLKTLLNHHVNFDVVAEAATESEAVEQALACEPECGCTLA